MFSRLTKPLTIGGRSKSTCSLDAKSRERCLSLRRRRRSIPKFPFPSLPIVSYRWTQYWTPIFLSQVATRVHPGLFEEGGERMCNSLRCYQDVDHAPHSQNGGWKRLQRVHPGRVRQHHFGRGRWGLQHSRFHLQLSSYARQLHYWGRGRWDCRM